jgi:hypothetical protein
MQLGTVTIARRFRGPPNSGNGGYSCGRLAAFVDGPAEVTLRRPPPLESEMQVKPEDGGIAMYAGDQLIASARPVEPWSVDAAAPAFEEALAATGRTFDPSVHKLPMCYVCGPDRLPGDGLRIFCGPVDPADTSWCGTVAAPWVPEPYMAGADGSVSAEFLWAALDCPTAYASGSPAGFPTILLGRQAVTILNKPAVGEKCIIAAHRTGRDGRKYLAEASLFNEAGTPLAHCRATWIEVAPDVQRGSG